mmetsp:Transcript_9560/g.23181  ORF Transcript_9560/g.23181 Transcript_9560/m.23181 type:complete len:351 (-) Transcript_9560:145-1197(-)|eukprot:CAMPEP_0172400072 /NCGR_PEP_ID=MMETSP1061-20121228/43979_1 /TAXON_ID=37318 /ORGANISM="Pseudo-nitzschia pungens, Strain cf. pungens" /LENGTH=350 /DNA_ID=CAMNT_0013133177 /DNA_START=120 /DNA_END=1172 /DNA_ORIENTATION=+
MSVRRRSTGFRSSQMHESSTSVGAPIPTRSRSAERSSIRNSGSWDCAEAIVSNDSDRSGNDRMQRSNSDPFDYAGEELEETRVQNETTGVKALPTLFRFPCTETRNQNCWSETPNEMFAIRGPGYLNGDKSKIQSKKYICRARGCDLFLTTDNSSSDATILEAGLSGNLRKKPTFLFRFLFPWGMLLQYYEVPPKLVPFMNMGMANEEKQALSLEDFTTAEKALARWLASDDPDFKNDRLKLIAIVPEGPFLVRNLVTGKPSLIGKRLQVSYQHIPQQNHLECLQICDLDISSGSAIAKKTVSVTRRYLSTLKAVDIGFVIEGKTPAELPEEMMGSTRLHQVDPQQAPTI